MSTVDVSVAGDCWLSELATVEVSVGSDSWLSELATVAAVC